MRIAIIASVWISVPPKGFGFGAQEYLAYYLSEGLIGKGHEVTLFASSGSQTKAKLISASEKPVIEMDFADPKIKDMFELINLSNAYKNASSFDIIHNHLLPYGAVFADLTSTPTVHTLHHQIYREKADIFLYEKNKNQNYISISNAQRNIIPELNYIKTVYNGIDPTFYSFRSNPESDYMLFIGRMKKYKGIHTAIQIAKKMNLKLIIASPLPNPKETSYKEVMGYWNNEISPFLDKNITYINGLKGEEKIKTLQNAKLLISPIEREEPFGMTLIEAMSCGTPVIAYDCGASSELILDGQTGFLVNYDSKNPKNWLIKKSGIEGLEDAINTIYKMSSSSYLNLRTKAREHVKNNFSIKKMVDEYEKVYRTILDEKTK